MNLNRWDTACALSHSHIGILERMRDRGSRGNVLEIGVANGGSALALMGLVADQNHFLCTVDPWGGYPYATSGARYGAECERGAMVELSRFANQENVNWQHWRMPSLQFLGLIVPLGTYYGGKRHPYEWDTVYLDGEHLAQIVLDELDMLALNAGAVVFIDNANHAQHAIPGGVNDPRTKDGMEAALKQWAFDNHFTCELIPYPDGDVLAELRAAQ